MLFIQYKKYRNAFNRILECIESIKTQNNKDIAKVDKKLIKFVRLKVKIVFFFNKLVDETGSSVEDLHNIAHLFNIVFIYLFIYLFYLHIYPPDSQKSDGGANT